MPEIEKIVYFLNRRDEKPNRQLAKTLAATENKDGIQEIAENLWNKNKNLGKSCIDEYYIQGETISRSNQASRGLYSS